MKEFAYIHDEKQSPSPVRAVPALASFSDDQLDDVLNSSSLLQCEPGDHIIKEGSIDSRIYVLLSGELEVRVGGKKVAAITRIGEVFGELALVNHDKRLASVIASTKAVCLAVDQKFLQDIHPREEDPISTPRSTNSSRASSCANWRPPPGASPRWKRSCVWQMKPCRMPRLRALIRRNSSVR
jgi:hypothetical protein